MADFCKQDSIDMWGRDTFDMRGLSTPEDTANDLYAVVLCEHCGPILVDHTGLCMGGCWESTHVTMPKDIWLEKSRKELGAPLEK